MSTPLGRVRTYAKQVREDIASLFKHVEDLNYRTKQADKHFEDAKKHFNKLHSASDNRANDLESRIDKIQDRASELEHMLTVLKQQRPSKVTGKAEAGAPPATVDTGAELFADNHALDAWYLEFENQFRGSEDEIKQKQSHYVKLFKDAKLDKKLPIADLGCGRGEFLDLLKENGLKPVGVDMNQSMVKRATEKGYEAVLNDAISYLLAQPSNSLAGVTGFHLAEHIPFDQLLTLIAEANRCLVKGGILLLETPNPESLFVGAFTFHYDPSHLKPIPPAIMQFSAKFKGFDKADILRQAPEMTEKEIKAATDNPKLQAALQRLYGPRDYALYARK